MFELWVTQFHRSKTWLDRFALCPTRPGEDGWCQIKPKTKGATRMACFILSRGPCLVHAFLLPLLWSTVFDLLPSPPLLLGNKALCVFDFVFPFLQRSMKWVQGLVVYLSFKRPSHVLLIILFPIGNLLLFVCRNSPLVISFPLYLSTSAETEERERWTNFMPFVDHLGQISRKQSLLAWPIQIMGRVCASACTAFALSFQVFYCLSRCWAKRNGSIVIRTLVKIKAFELLAGLAAISDQKHATLALLLNETNVQD